GPPRCPWQLPGLARRIDLSRRRELAGAPRRRLDRPARALPLGLGTAPPPLVRRAGSRVRSPAAVRRSGARLDSPGRAGAGRDLRGLLAAGTDQRRAPRRRPDGVPATEDRCRPPRRPGRRPAMVRRASRARARRLTGPVDSPTPTPGPVLTGRVGRAS